MKGVNSPYTFTKLTLQLCNIVNFVILSIVVTKEGIKGGKHLEAHWVAILELATNF